MYLDYFILDILKHLFYFLYLYVCFHVLLSWIGCLFCKLSITKWCFTL